MTVSQDKPLLSIVIPAYNEERRLPDSLDQIDAFVQSKDYGVEVIVVDNNSSDGTADVTRVAATDRPYVRLLHEPVQGKGAAVKMGMLAAEGEYLFICDADLSMPIEEVAKFVPPALNGHDVAIASREVEGARRFDEPEYRHIMGRVFNLIVRVLALPNIQDSQCGFKVFRREVAREIFPLQTIDGWGFDVEVLFIARRRGYKLEEVPINWYYRANSRINPIRDAINMFVEVLRVRINGWLGRYGKGVQDGKATQT
jgi:glycosyltransferase involved in cell wall biosynthesis